MIKSIRKCVEIDIPSEFVCDICGRSHKVPENGLTMYRRLSNVMAVVKYSTPGQYGDINHELHCCCMSCLFKAIKKVPFDATISIPVCRDLFKDDVVQKL